MSVLDLLMLFQLTLSCASFSCSWGENDLILGIQDLNVDCNILAKFLGIQDLSIHFKVFQGILGILVYLYDIIIIYAFIIVIHDPTSCKL